jgi:predicted MFS family arabinose efflux permease
MPSDRNVAAETPSVPGRKLLVLMLFLSCTLNFADRAVFSALAQVIKADLKLTDLELGLLQGLVFAFLYAAVGLPIGFLCERKSRKHIVAIATAIWSLATAFTGIASNFIQLALSRMIVGMGEAGFTPATASMVADVVPRQRRASTMALILLGTPLGTFGGATLAGHIAASWDWRTAFLAFAVPGIIVALGLVILVTEPKRGVFDNPSTAQDPAPSIKQFVVTVINNRPLCWVILGGGLAGFGMTAISQFLAVHLARTHDLNIRDAATAFGAISGISITFGLLVGSFGTDYLARKDVRWPAWGAAIGLICATPLYWTAFYASALTPAFVLLLCAGGFLLMFYGPTTGMIQNLLPVRMRATGVATYTLLYTLIGSGLGPVFVGGASDLMAARAYGGNYLLDCPYGLPPTGASEAIVAACSDASARGMQSALSVVVAVFLISGFCFLRAAPGLLAKAQEHKSHKSA